MHEVLAERTAPVLPVRYVLPIRHGCLSDMHVLPARCAPVLGRFSEIFAGGTAAVLPAARQGRAPRRRISYLPLGKPVIGFGCGSAVTLCMWHEVCWKRLQIGKKCNDSLSVWLMGTLCS
jgi:hypothetical protein